MLMHFLFAVWTELWLKSLNLIGPMPNRSFLSQKRTLYRKL